METELENVVHKLGMSLVVGLTQGCCRSRLELGVDVLHKCLVHEEGFVEVVEKLGVVRCSCFVGDAAAAAVVVAAVVVAAVDAAALIVVDFAVDHLQTSPWKLGMGED